MQKNWKEVPRDPIVDDEQLEYLYERATRPPAVEPTNPVTGRSENVEGRRKQPLPAHKLWPLRKLFS